MGGGAGSEWTLRDDDMADRDDPRTLLAGDRSCFVGDDRMDLNGDESYRDRRGDKDCERVCEFVDALMGDLELRDVDE